MSAYQNPQGSTVIVQHEGSLLRVTICRDVDDPPVSEASWSAQLAAAARRELGCRARRVSAGGAVGAGSSGSRRERRSAVYMIDSAFTVTHRGEELTVAVAGPLTAHGARALADRLPQHYSVRRRGAGWWVTHQDVPLRELTIGAKVVLAVAPRCELAEHFGRGVAATTRVTVRGSMAPFVTTAHTCDEHTPTPADIVAHNSALGETVDSIEIAELSSGQTVASWAPVPVATGH
ncbi:hypothetical protein HLB23_14105 [Nocardia uniformis]|uniref:Uncharacterized protein n=1 Tax=Nocardia uniformis TaxID=53432 RepID=A0A849BWP6_9NOCA|nr:hypothetical protein [Nocardia uniformis]NNH70982.1 hypothetical protein [Nocardia uniformis]